MWTRSRLMFWLGLGFGLFQLFVPVLGSLYDMQLRALHVLFGISLVLLALPLGGKRQPRALTAVDLLLAAVIVAANLLVYLNWEEIVSMVGVAGPVEIALGAALSLIVLEAARRAAGAAIPIMVLLAFGYVFVGPLMPGMWAHPGFPVTYIIEQLYYSSGGIYGSLTGTSATFIAVFILFGALLQATGGGQAFMDLALIAAGRFPGGPAQVATVSSALFGMISGSAVANVSVNGTYTIPLMRRLGYDRNFAAGVEAMSSTGGGITPPIMGIAAFIMADLLNISYLQVIGHALIPCLLFYVGIIAGVHFEARLASAWPWVPAAEIPRAREVITWRNMAPLDRADDRASVRPADRRRGQPETNAGVYAGCLATIADLPGGGDLAAQAGWRRRPGPARRGLCRGRRRHRAGRAAAGGRSACSPASPVATGVAPKISMVIIELGGGQPGRRAGGRGHRASGARRAAAGDRDLHPLGRAAGAGADAARARPDRGAHVPVLLGDAGRGDAADLHGLRGRRQHPRRATGSAPPWWACGSASSPS